MLGHPLDSKLRQSTTNRHLLEGNLISTRLLHWPIQPYQTTKELFHSKKNYIHRSKSNIEIKKFPITKDTHSPIKLDCLTHQYYWSLEFRLYG